MEINLNSLNFLAVPQPAQSDRGMARKKLLERAYSRKSSNLQKEMLTNPDLDSSYIISQTLKTSSSQESLISMKSAADSAYELKRD